MSSPRGFLQNTRHTAKLMFYWIGFVIKNVKSQILLALLISAIAISAISTNIFTVRYFKQFNITTQTQFDNETEKFFASVAPQHQLIERINTSTPPDAKFLVFRESDFAFYAHRDFIYHPDNQISQLFRMTDIEEAMDFMADQGLSYIYVPGYPLPSIYNSIIGDILASPSHSELIFDYSGYRLFKLRFDSPPIETEYLVGEDFVQTPQAMQNWTHNPPFSRPSGQENQNSGLFIPHQNAILSTDLNSSLATRSDQNLGLKAPFINKSFGLHPQKPYRFSSTLEGSGYLEIFLKTVTLEDDLSFLHKVPIWSGVLNGNKRTISAVFMDSLGFINTDPNLGKDRRYTLSYRLNSGKYVRIFDWSIQNIQKNQSGAGQTQSLQKQRFFENGWTIQGSLNTGRTPYFGAQESIEGNTIFLNSKGARTYRLVSPGFYAPPEIRTRFNVGITQSNTLSPPIDYTQRPVIDISFEAKGDAKIILVVQTACQNQSSANFPRSIKTIPLSAPEKQTFTTSFYGDCFPKRLNTQFELQARSRGNNFSPLLPLDIELTNLQIHLTYIDMNGHPQKIELAPVNQSMSYQTAS